MSKRDWGVHINVLGWIYILGNALLLVIGLIGLIFLSGIGLLSGDATAVPVLTFIGGIGAVFFAVLAVPGLIAGYGLLTRAPWARVLTLVIGFLEFFNVPVGTAVAIYTYVVLLQADIDEYFGPLKTA